ncbi:MAG TPA: hypothetical protein VH393_04275 [Ktedonobacterales bacterium]
MGAQVDPMVGIEALGAPSAYDFALSRVLATLLTETDWRIQRFRAIHLNGELLEWVAVEDWMRARAEDSSATVDETTRYVNVAVSAAALWQAQERVAAGMPGTVTFEIPDKVLLGGDPRPLSISYVVPNEAIPHWKYLKKGTALEQLRAVVTHLVAAAPWSEAQASVFVLTGLTPLILQLRGTSKMYTRMATLPRITLEVDPRITQRELATAYQDVRAQLATDVRHRDLSEKHLALAVFGTTPEGTEGSPAQRMSRWNAAHPDWTYRRTDHFTRDVLHARRRLLRDLPPYPPHDGLHEEGK